MLPTFYLKTARQVARAAWMQFNFEARSAQASQSVRLAA